MRTSLENNLFSLCLAVVASSGLFLLTSGNVQAQLFGNRSVGNPIRSPSGRQAGAASSGASTSSSDVGVLSGNERFLRGNRSRRDFVGSDRNEQSGFVGSQQALGTGRVRAATEGLQIETADELRINRPLPLLPATGPYYARLDLEVVDSQFFRERAIRNQGKSNSQPTSLQRVQRLAGMEAKVSFEGRLAVLSGFAKSQKAAELAEVIVGFEPGVDFVKNELQIVQTSDANPL